MTTNVGRVVGSGATRVYGGASIVDVIGDVPPALIGLIRQIPAKRGWTEQRRDEFIRAFTAVLDFTVPVVTEIESANELDSG